MEGYRFHRLLQNKNNLPILMISEKKPPEDIKQEFRFGTNGQFFEVRFHKAMQDLTVAIVNRKIEIPEESKSRIFRRFCQVDRRTP